MKSMENLAVIIVTYNRQAELKRLLEMLDSQSLKPGRTIIFDNNSTDDTELMVKQPFNNLSIEYIKLTENIGGAGGFNLGLEHAFNSGFDYFCLMDDDGYPYNEYSLDNLFNYALLLSSSTSTFVINSLVITDELNLSFGLCGTNSIQQLNKIVPGKFIEGEVNPFNGTLLTREVVNLIGLPRKDYFIKGDEREYIMRAKEAGVLVGTLKDSLFFHPRNVEYRRVKFIFKSVNVFIEPPWKFYYRVRNYTHIAISRRNYGFIKTLVIWLLMIPFMGSFKYFRYYFKGLSDAIFNKLGRGL
jgi:GT2 family glycosyltransferase